MCIRDRPPDAPASPPPSPPPQPPLAVAPLDGIALDQNAQSAASGDAIPVRAVVGVSLGAVFLVGVLACGGVYATYATVRRRRKRQREEDVAAVHAEITIHAIKPPARDGATPTALKLDAAAVKVEVD